MFSSDCLVWSNKFSEHYRKLPKSDSADFVDAPKFHYDMDFDLRALKAALKSAEFLEESGYQSVLERSQNNQYGTGWLINENMSEDGSDDVDDNWGKFIFISASKTSLKLHLDFPSIWIALFGRSSLPLLHLTWIQIFP